MTSVLFEHDNFGHLFYEMICFFNEWSKWASLHMTQNFLIFSSTCFLNNFFLKKKIEGTMTIWLEMKEYNSASTTNGFSKHDNSWHSFNEVIFFFRGGGDMWVSFFMTHNFLFFFKGNNIFHWICVYQW